jgi:transposase
MAKGIHKKHSKSFKLKVAIAALKGDKTTGELCSEFCVVASQVNAWRKQLEQQGAEIFADKRQGKDQKDTIDKLHRIIGEITAERDFLVRGLNR